MKTKMLLTAALVGAASLSALSAQAGAHFGFLVGLPLPVVVTAPVAPVYVTAPAPAVVVDTPACPGPDYVWAPGYWTVHGYDRVWVAGNWNYRPAHVVYDRGFDHDRAGYYGHDGYRR